MSNVLQKVMRLTAVLLAFVGTSWAAHVYAVSSDPWDSGLKVYKVQPDGSLLYKGKTTGPANNALVATPGGRYIYQFDGRWIIQYDVLNNGMLQQSQPPVTYPDNTPYTGISGVAMHPSGDYLFVLGGPAIHVFRTDDVDGHLTWLSSAACVECSNLAMEGEGEFLFAVSNSDQPNPGPMRMISSYRINEVDGTVSPTGQRWYGPGLDQSRLRADSRYVYATTWEQGDTYSFHVLAIEADGSLHEVAGGDGKQFYRMASIGRYLASSPSGKGSDVKVHALINGQFAETDVKPTEVMYDLTQGSGDFSHLLWVTTDDGIVTYRLVNGGKLVRVGKVMIPFANPVYFVNK